MMPRNKVQMIENTIQRYIDEQCRYGGAYADEPQQDILTDLLTDLRHYCEVRGLDFEYSARWSLMHQEAEALDALP